MTTHAVAHDDRTTPCSTLTPRGKAGNCAVGKAIVLVLASLWLAAGARAQESYGSTVPGALSRSDEALFDEFDRELEQGIRDPFERTNRRVFAVNRAISRAVIDPVARAYGAVVPFPIRRSVRGIFENLNQPVVIANDLLQLEPGRAAQASVRFLLNSTFGLAGIFDPALEAGFPNHRSDFGQTLGRAGLGPGPYLVIPLIGPSTGRDIVGSLVDMALRPDSWLLPLGPRLLLGGTWGIAEREAHGESLEALEQSSVDFYTAIRSAFWMSREAFVRGDDSDSFPPSIPPIEQAAGP
jgi:phospholipid-binding lipoprotein MlaA